MTRNTNKQLIDNITRIMKKHNIKEEPNEFDGYSREKLEYWDKRMKLLDKSFIDKRVRIETDMEKHIRLVAKIRLNDEILKQCKAWRNEGFSLESIAVKHAEKYGVEKFTLSYISRKINGK